MLLNHLKVNTEKTKALVVKSKNSFDSEFIENIKVNTDNVIEPSKYVKSLGVLFDEYLTLEEQISSILRSCYINLRNLRFVASKLNFNLKKLLIHCLIF